MTLPERLAAIDVGAMTTSLHARGHATLPQLVPHDVVDELVTGFDDDARYRKTVVMERYRFGRGTYRYYAAPLPPAVQLLRAGLYEKLVPVADEWMRRLGDETRFPPTLTALSALCGQRLQTLPTPLILRYGPGDFNTLHQDLYGEVWFPLQAIVVASTPDVDHTGGELVLTQQNPRAQSQAIVLRPNKGDVVVLATNFRPTPSRMSELGDKAALQSKGYTRVTLRHGVSEVHSGQRHAVGIIFHDAIS